MTKRNGHPPTVEDLLERAGGAPEVASRSESYGRSITVKGVYKWTVNGIPQWHWPLMKDLAGATEVDLYAANQALRNRSKARQGRAA